MKRKQAHHAVLRARAAAAIRDLYHNATPRYPREMYGRSDNYFQQWFSDAAHDEIEYLQSGGAYGSNYRATLEAPCNAGRYKSERAQRYYVDKGMRAMRLEREDCGALTGWIAFQPGWGARECFRGMPMGQRMNLKRHNVMWEYISEYGKLYTYGRGGRTLAPDELVTPRGGSGFSARTDYVPELSAADCVRLIQIVESFNAYVSAWCAGVPKLWREHCEYEDGEIRAEKRRLAANKARETRERNYWAARGMVTV